MTDRFSGRRERILNQEHAMNEKNDHFKRIAAKFAEENPTVPSIGELELPSTIQEPLFDSISQPPSSTRQLKSPRKIKANNEGVIEAPFQIRPPRSLNDDQIPLSSTHKTYKRLGATNPAFSVPKSPRAGQFRPLPSLKESIQIPQDTILPLEVFDDARYMEFPIETLLQNPTALSRFQDSTGEMVWKPCKCIGYDNEKELFTIEYGITKKTKKVARFNIRFLIENEEKFNKRVEVATLSCHKFEMLTRFNARIDALDVTNISEITDKQNERINAKIGCIIPKNYKNLHQNLLSENKELFKRQNKRLYYINDLINNENLPDRNEFLALLERKTERTNYGYPYRSEYDFQHILKTFSSVFLYSHPYLLKALQKISKAFVQTSLTRFLAPGYNNVLPLDDYIEKELTQIKETSASFKSTVQETIDMVITESLSNINSPTDTNMQKELYQRVISLSQRILHHNLLDSITKTLEDFANSFEKYKDKKDDMIPAQFLATLSLNEDKKLQISPSIDDFRTKIASILQKFEDSAATIPEIKFSIIDVKLDTVSFVDILTEIIRKRKDVISSFETILSGLSDFVDSYRSLEQVLCLNPDTFSTEFDQDGKKTIDEYSSMLASLRESLEIVSLKLHESYKIGMFQLECKEFKHQAIEIIEKLVLSLFERMRHFAQKETHLMIENLRDLIIKVSATTNTPEELGKLKDYMDNVAQSSKERQNKVELMLRRFDFLEAHHFSIDDEDTKQIYVLRSLPRELNRAIEAADVKYKSERVRMFEELKQNEAKLDDDTEVVSKEIPPFLSKFTDLEMTIDAVDAIGEIQSKVMELRQRQDKYNRQEILFDSEPQPSKKLSKLLEEFAPIYLMWTLAGDWNNNNNSWRDTPFNQIKSEGMNQFLVLSQKKISKLKKDLAARDEIVEKILIPLGDQIDQFKKRIPLISKLRHPGIKTKHWEQITKVVGFKVQPSMEMSLQQFLDLDLERWQKEISEIAGIAAQEYNIESMLDAMDLELQEKNFNVQPFRDSGSFILAEADQIISLIDDQLVTTQTLLTSPFIHAVKKRATERLQFLRRCHESLDAWMECQRGWLYLQPIFTGTSIQQKLHQEARDWQRVDKMWTLILTQTKTHPSFNNVMSRDHLFEDLSDANRLLDSITQGLNAYLEAKRLGFPRFFFLSNDELISILSHTKDFDQIQKSMNKLFEYVQTITVSNKMVISHMNDDGLEKVKLINEINGDTPEIEDWLNAFEKEMQNTLKYNIREAIPASDKKRREEWLVDFPAQVILTVNQILWTTQVTEAIENAKIKSKNLTSLMKRFLENLNGLTDMIRKPLDPATRQCISCMLIFEVHNRDIIQKLIDENIDDTDDFKWAQQLRYYWENDTVMVRSINNDYEYAYEYAGNSARLVITPLTDRCYQTLLAAFKLNMSGAPSGPAGTGKTETVRDCAKALGRPCVVYNCSEEVTPEQMSQFFAGLSSSGTWSCFDEFNRINIEVLSVIAQQVRCIQEAIAARAETFQLDARKLKLNMNAAICITMNPGYAGRTELPDNLKALFRPCAMMVPDFVFISEIMLFSGGYNTASQLSVKLVALFDLCRKQLSNAYHYDWGLRAMKAILSTAGKAKRNNLQAQEAKLLFESIRDCTRPRLVNTDIPLFEGIMHDVFPEVVSEKSLDIKMMNYMVESYIEQQTQPLDLYVKKCNEIYETTLVRHGIMFVGGAMGGKSTAWKALQKTLGKLSNEGIGKAAATFILNPKAISIPELYGLFDPVTSGWTDGVLSSFIRDCSMSEPTEWKWIVVDGPVDSLWIETMNSLLDDNKVLCLSNNERISLGAHCKMMFEVDDLSQASPATVSRCGMIYFDPVTLPWTAIADSWVTSCKFQEIAKFVRQQMEKYVPRVLTFVQCDAKVAIGSNTSFYVKNMLNIIDCFFDIMREPQEIISADGEDPRQVDPLDHTLYFSRYTKKRENTFGYFDQENVKPIFEKILLFAIVWSFGSILAEDSRSIFDNLMRDMLNKSSNQFPDGASCFDFYVDIKSNEWSPFVDGELGIEFIPKDELENSKKNPVESLFIPTPESSAMTFVTRLLVEHQHNVLFHGPESSKSLTVQNLYSNVLSKKFDCKNLPIANCSTAKNILHVLRSFMHKHHGVYGPLVDHQLLIFLDNIGSVKPEVYGAQPPLELIRQFCDYGGWYNTANVEFQRVVDTTLIAGMGPAGSGLFSIPERLMRHFNLIHCPKMRLQSMDKVLKSILKLKFVGFQDEVQEIFSKTVDAAMEIHKQCVENLLPIPSKLHYIFSLRNIVRVLKGMLLVKPSDIPDAGSWARLFTHEMMREYNDRFNVDEDRKWFLTMIKSTLNSKMGIDFDSICPNGILMFNEFADRAGRYKEIKSKPSDVIQTCREMLEDHNRDASKQLDIVIFDEAVDHISNLNRILTLPRGHAILVGVKSSGRKSLARLSLHMSSMESFEIQITRTYSFTEWREDLKNLMKNMGVNDTPTGFIISDSQIIGAYQLEDISNMLIHGEVPNLFAREEMEQIKADIINNEMITDGDPWKLFIDRCIQHLHIILVFSPYGSTFKESMLAFPALRTETTIDWYMPWSRNALESVANAAFSKANLSNIKSVVNVCVEIHKSVERAADRYLREAKRFTACTPSRYFELLYNFVERLNEQQEAVQENIRKYVGGVEKITTTREQINVLKNELDAAIPILEKQKKEVEEMLKTLQVKQKEVEGTKVEVQKQSDDAAIEEQKAQEKNAIAQQKLAEAQPILQKAQDAVDSMDKNSLVNIKTLKKISPALRETFEAICIIFQRSPRRVDGPTPGTKVDDYWPETLTLINDSKFVSNIKNFDVPSLPKTVIDKLKKYVPAENSARESKLEDIMKGYKAVSNLYLWVCASYDYWGVYQTIIPVKQEADEAAQKLAESQKKLAESKAYLKSVEDQLAELQKTFDKAMAEEKALADDVSHKQLRLDRAQKIMSGLSGETTRWEASAANLKETAGFLLGDTLLSAASMTHLAAFSPSFRYQLIEEWKSFLVNENIKHNEKFSIEKSLGVEQIIRDWVVKGLPNDSHSIENAIIINNSKNAFPLLIDPQLSGTKWLRNVLGEKLNVLRFDQPDFLQRLRGCVSIGLSVLIENVGLKLDPLIEPILSREVINNDGQKKIALGGEYISYSDDFRLYLSTKYPNPHYSPEVCSQVTLVNFTTTQDGLSDLLMNNLLEVERKDLDEKRIQLMEANAANMIKLKQVENEILQIVSNAGADILEDDTAIETLQKAQKTSQMIEQQMIASKKTEEQILDFRTKMMPVSARAALLYFCASDFQVIDPMYQFSLKWFVNIFKNAVISSEHPQDVNELVTTLNLAIARSFFQSVSFSLFSRHKLLFSTLMAVRILMSENRLRQQELAFMLQPMTLSQKIPNPTKWLPDEIWNLFVVLPSLNEIFAALVDNFTQKEDEWKTFYKSSTPENDDFPYKSTLSLFQQLVVLRVFHLHRVREGLRIFVSGSLGNEFMQPPPLNLSKVFKESSPLSPLIFIITPGIDPQDEIINVAQSMELEKFLKSYSLGRGRGAGAEALIEEGADKGYWILLQNCHLSLSWMPKLETIIDNLDPEKVSQRFRLCLVTMSDPNFPIGILYQGSKLIYEIPKGIRENMIRVYSGISAEEYKQEYSEMERKLTFHLSFFHAVVLERLLFGSIGWNIPYEFNPSDLTISRKHLRMFLSENSGYVPYDSLGYVIGELNYGGRVTDKWDRRLLLTLLRRYFSPEIEKPDFSFGERYKSPVFSDDVKHVEDILQMWPVVTEGSDVGLSANASTISARNTALGIFNSLIEIQPTLVASSGSISEEQFALSLVDKLISQVPQSFNIHKFTQKFDLSDTINTVLHHEIILYNKLLEYIRSSLTQLQKGLKGLIVIDNELEILNKRILSNKVPEAWLVHSFPSILTLSSYMEDLKFRVSFIDNWIRTKRPNVFKIGAFFHPEEFLTAVLQVYARKHVVPFDKLSWATTVTNSIHEQDFANPPEEGIYIQGLFLEGAKWDLQNSKLVECEQKELIAIMPIVHLYPTQDRNLYDMTKTFECTMYRMQNRGSGAMGLPNYIMSLFIPTPDVSPDHWIERSVATFITVQN